MNRIEEKNNLPEVSVIVPTYNVADFIGCCLNSLKNQTLSNIEVIVVDDGSSDGTVEICNKFAESDSRFVIVHQNHSGCSAARNEGIKRAKAKYLMFVDGDDWVEPDYCKTPYDEAEGTGAEIVIFQFLTHNRKGISRKIIPKEGITDKGEVLTDLWDYTCAAVWNKFFSRRLFDNIRFPEGRLYEDAAVTHKLIKESHSVSLVGCDLYHYRNIRPGSITHKKTGKVLEEYFYWNLQRMDDLKSWGLHCETEEWKYSLAYLVDRGKNSTLSDRCIECLKTTDLIDMQRVSLREKVIYNIYRYWPWLFELICKKTGKRVQ